MFASTRFSVFLFVSQFLLASSGVLADSDRYAHIAFSLPIPSQCETRCANSHGVDLKKECPNGCFNVRRDLPLDPFSCNQTTINDLADCIGCIIAYNSTIDPATEQADLDDFTQHCGFNPPGQPSTVSNVTIKVSKTPGAPDSSSSNKTDWAGKSITFGGQGIISVILVSAAAAFML
ncbi:hypothetical protein C8J56DRAFT_900903 [Mycena floridula]|nr:hypothetical protein C8J56DRAFT_900903 [Mycena floridula]